MNPISRRHSYIKIINDKKYRNLNEKVQKSILTICKYIHSIRRGMEIEVEDISDIQFYDLKKYYLEVKSLLFLEQRTILDRFEKVNNEFNDFLSSSKNKFYLGHAINRDFEIFQEKSISNSLSIDSSSIFMFDSNFLPSKKLFQDLWTKVSNAKLQLNKISDPGVKIVVIDISQHPFIEPLKAWKFLNILWKDNSLGKDGIDGISLFCLYSKPTKNGNFSLGLTKCISDIDIETPLFNQLSILTEWNVMTIPTHATFESKKETSIAIQKNGDLTVKGINFAPFWKSSNILQNKDTRNFDEN